MTAQRIGHSDGESSKRSGGNFKFTSSTTAPSKPAPSKIVSKKQAKQNNDDDDDDDDDDDVPLVKVSYANKRSGQGAKKPIPKLQQDDDESLEVEKSKKSSKKSGKLNVKTGTSRYP